jgi:hypothetical protein
VPHRDLRTSLCRAVPAICATRRLPTQRLRPCVANSIAHDFAVLPKFVHITPASSIAQDSAVLPKSVRTVPVVRGSTLQPALGTPPQQSTAMESEPRPATTRVEFSGVATTLSSRPEPVDVCAKYGGHRVHFMRGHHAMWKCVYRKRRQ